MFLINGEKYVYICFSSIEFLQVFFFLFYKKKKKKKKKKLLCYEIHVV